LLTWRFEPSVKVIKNGLEMAVPAECVALSIPASERNLIDANCNSRVAAPRYNAQLAIVVDVIGESLRRRIGASAFAWILAHFTRFDLHCFDLYCLLT
jgi:hypothetical protein